MSFTRRHVLAGVAAGLLPSLGHAQPTPKRGGTLVATWGGFEPQALFVPPGGGTSPFFTSTKPLERLLALDQQLKWQPVLAQRVEPAADFRSFTGAAASPGTTARTSRQMTWCSRPCSTGSRCRSAWR